MTQPRWLNPDEAAMWRAFHEMQRRFFRVVDQQLAGESQLSSADYEILVAVSESEGQRLRARDLGRQIGWDRSRLSHQLRRMELRDQIRRRTCPTDGRGTFIELTDAGRAAVAHAAPSHVDTVRANLIDLLTPEEIETMTAICTRVVAHIDSSGAAATDCDAEEPCPTSTASEEKA